VASTADGRLLSRRLGTGAGQGRQGGCWYAARSPASVRRDELVCSLWCALRQPLRGLIRVAGSTLGERGRHPGHQRAPISATSASAPHLQRGGCRSARACTTSCNHRHWEKEALCRLNGRPGYACSGGRNANYRRVSTSFRIDFARSMVRAVAQDDARKDRLTLGAGTGIEAFG